MSIYVQGRDGTEARSCHTFEIELLFVSPVSGLCIWAEESDLLGGEGWSGAILYYLWVIDWMKPYEFAVLIHFWCTKQQYYKVHPNVDITHKYLCVCVCLSYGWTLELWGWKGPKKICPVSWFYKWQNTSMDSRHVQANHSQNVEKNMKFKCVWTVAKDSWLNGC